ncbi:MAG: hypothetical protein MJZ28_08870 [Paludibacteraceae bacterium]|nr:hypothetical protein [Paludibacteraceae bacterium]
MKQLYKLFLIAFLLLAFDAHAQRRAFDNEVVNEEVEKEVQTQKKIVTLTLRAYRINGDTAHMDIPMHQSKMFFNGNFFKRVNERRLNLPSNTLRDRYFECDNCNILDYSVVKHLNSTRVNAFDLEVPMSVRKCNMTTTSKNGDTLMVTNIEIFPKAELYMKINDKTLVKVDSTTNFPSLITGNDKLEIVIASDGTNLAVKSHYLKSLYSMGNILIEKNPGTWITDKEKNILLSSRRRNRLFLTVEIAEPDRTWEKSFSL